MIGNPLTLGGGGSGAVKMDLLWTNPDPTVNFAAQSIGVDIRSYDAVLVFYMFSLTTTRAMSCLAPTSATGLMLYCVYDTSSTQGGRQATFVSGDISFDVGHTATATDAPAFAVPTAVYGVKF